MAILGALEADPTNEVGLLCGALRSGALRSGAKRCDAARSDAMRSGALWSRSSCEPPEAPRWIAATSARK
jgi:hypothetical protein